MVSAMNKRLSAANILIAAVPLFFLGYYLNHLCAFSIIHELWHGVGGFLSGAGVEIGWSMSYATPKTALFVYAGYFGEFLTYYLLTAFLLQKGWLLGSAFSWGMLNEPFITAPVSDDFTWGAENFFGGNQAPMIVVWFLFCGTFYLAGWYILIRMYVRKLR